MSFVPSFLPYGVALSAWPPIVLSFAAETARASTGQRTDQELKTLTLTNPGLDDELQQVRKMQVQLYK